MVRLAVLLALVSIAGCVRENPDLVDCVESADCPPGFFCRDHLCTVPDAMRGAAPMRDGGTDGDARPAGRDADTRPDVAGDPADACVAVCQRVVACVVGPDCPLLGPEAADDLLDACKTNCRGSTAFTDAVRGHASCAETVSWLIRGSDPFADACLGDAPPDQCAEGFVRGAVCDRRLDCCDRGLVCADLGDGSRCRTACDAHRVPTGCQARAFCNPQMDVEDRSRPSPGVCIQGDDCIPGREAAGCEGPSTCFPVPPASFCAPAGDAAEDEGCTLTLDNTIDNCEPGLVCAYGRCAPPCDDRGRCREGECVDYTERLDGLEFRFCHDGCDVYRQRGCAGGRVCSVVDADTDGRAVGACRVGEAGRGRQGERCRSDPDRYWGDCHPGHVCGRLSSGRGEQCIGFCDESDTRLCTGASLCVFGLLDQLDLGLCLGECDIYADAECGEGRFCRFIAVGASQNGRSGPVGQCTAGGGERGAGSTCTVTPETGAHDCAPGHLCGDGGDDTLRCLRVCDDDHRCPGGQVCNPVFGGGIGTCD